MTEDNDTASNRQDAVASAFALIDAIRDNCHLERWAVDELLDLQPSNEHAKALLVALAVHEILPPDEADEAMASRSLGAY